MSKSKATIGIGLGVLASAGLASYLAGRRAVPSLSGTIRLMELAEPVEVLRDSYGIPAIHAANEDDLYFVQGYLQAADRLFQLDLYRRVGYGELAEIVGEPGLGSDKLVRVLGFGRAAEGDVGLMSPEARRTLERFAAGVNCYMRQARRKLPIECTLLGYKPRPWKPAHSLVFSRLMALGLCGNWEAELARAEIASRFGDEVLQKLDDDADSRPFPAQIGAEVLGQLATAAREASAVFGSGGDIGSNNWVIGSRRTKSGGAVLANDPHLDLNLPSVWYENVLRCPTVEVRGFSIPGTPGIALGHNGKIAWGFTNSDADVQDLYFEELDGAETHYRDTDGEMHPLETHTEKIAVKGDTDHVITVRRTRRGPILSDAIATDLEKPISIRWQGIGPGKLNESVFLLNRATNWDEFREALKHWSAPSQNVVYADTRGNIGYQMCGEIPTRAKGNGTLPHQGRDPDGEWTGTVPYGEMPTALNPASDRIVTANDKVVPDDFPYFISCEWMNGYRGDRIRECIDANDDHTVPDSVAIQCDLYSIPGRQLVEVLSQHAFTPQTKRGREMLSLLQGWDYEMRADDDAAIAYRLVMRSLQEQIFGFLGDEMLPLFLGYSRTGMNGFWSLFNRSVPRIIKAIRENDSDLLELGASCAGVATTDSWKPMTSWPEVLAHALDHAGQLYEGSDGRPMRIDPATRKLHATSRSGRVGKVARAPAAKMGQRFTHRARLHRIRFQHPLGVVSALAPLVNRGPYPMPGDPDTVWQAAQFHNTTNDSAMVGPSHRHVIDMSDVDGAQAVVAGGVSGHPASPHYADQLPLWRAGEARPAPFTREALEGAARFRQRFEPTR